MTLVSQALLVTLTLSKPYSFLPFWPKTWLFAVQSYVERGRLVDQRGDGNYVPIFGCPYKSRHNDEGTTQ